MSYSKRIPQEDLDQYRIIKSWRAPYDRAAYDFACKFPDQDIANAEILIEREIFP